MGAREKIAGLFPSEGLGQQVADEILAEHRMEIATEIRARMSEIRAEDWGKSNRTKVTWLRAMEMVRKRIVLKGIDLKEAGK